MSLLLLFNQPASSQSLSPSLFTNTNTFYSATVTAGAITLQPGLFSDADSFYAATVSRGAVTLSPPLFSDGDAFYSATVITHYTLTPSLFADGDSFYSATVARGAVTLLPSLFGDADVFYSATLSGGTAIIAPALFVNQNVFFPATVRVPSAETGSSASWWWWQQQQQTYEAGVDGVARGDVVEAVAYIAIAGEATGYGATIRSRVPARVSLRSNGAAEVEAVASGAILDLPVFYDPASVCVDGQSNSVRVASIASMAAGSPSIAGIASGSLVMSRSSFDQVGEPSGDGEHRLAA